MRSAASLNRSQSKAVTISSPVNLQEATRNDVLLKRRKRGSDGYSSLTSRSSQTHGGNRGGEHRQARDAGEDTAVGS